MENSQVTELIAGVLFALLILFYRKIKEVIMFYLLDLLSKHPASPGKSTVVSQGSINAKIIEILTKLDSDRAYVFEFHNGSTFSSKQPCWKLSCTYEYCRNGISYQTQNFQNVITSNIIDIILPLWGESKLSGLNPLVCKLCHGELQKEKCPLKGVYEYTIDKLPEGYAKSLMKARGTSHMLFAPLLNKEQNGIVGFIGIDYCNFDDYKTPQNYVELCHTASDVSFLLNK